MSEKIITVRLSITRDSFLKFDGDCGITSSMPLKQDAQDRISKIVGDCSLALIKELTSVAYDQDKITYKIETEYVKG